MEAYSHLASVYDRLMDDVDYQMWAANIHELIGRKNARVFEAACGTGNITQRLCGYGHTVTAADSSAAMLEIASQKAREAGCAVTFVRQDMRDIAVGNKVDAVVCACDGPNYIDENGLCRFSQSAFVALKPGGVLLFDVSTREKLSAMDGQVYFDDGDDLTCVWQNSYDAHAHTLKMDVVLFVREAEHYRKLNETHVQYAHDAEAIKRILCETGFGDICVYDGFTRSECTASSQRAQFVCRKLI